MPSLRLSKLIRTNPDRPTLKQRAAALKATAARVIKRKPADRSETGSCPPGFMPHPPTGEPEAFMSVPAVIFAESQRLLRLATRELDRRLDAMDQSLGAAQQHRQEMSFRRRLRIDDLMRLAGQIEPGSTASPEHVGDDAELLALEAEFKAADARCLDTACLLSAAENAYAAPPMPAALHVWRNDWIFSSIPRPEVMSLGSGSGRHCPYGAKEVEQLRGKAHTQRVLGAGEGEPDLGGGRIVIDKQAQERGDVIVAAWDEWQAATASAREAGALPTLEVERDEALEQRNGLLRRIRETRPQSLTGLAVKARTAGDMAGEGDMRKAAGRRDPDDSDGLLHALAADVLELLGRAEAPPVTPDRPAASPAPEFDFSSCSLRQLDPLHEAVRSIWLHVSAEAQAPWCWDGRGENHNAVGRILDAEAERLARLHIEIAAEARRRAPINEDERDERLNLLVQHELHCEDRITDPALFSEIVAAWGDQARG